jgi:hypothetical protein
MEPFKIGLKESVADGCWGKDPSPFLSQSIMNDPATLPERVVTGIDGTNLGDGVV